MTAITIAVLNAFLWEEKQMHSVTETGQLSAENYATGCPCLELCIYYPGHNPYWVHISYSN